MAGVQRTAVTTRAPTSALTNGRHPTAGGAAPASNRVSAVLTLQRTAGNAAVSALLERLKPRGSTLVATSHALQRWSIPLQSQPAKPSPGKGRPAGVAEHLATEAELADMPATTDAPGLLAEVKQIYADRESRRRAAKVAAKKGEPVDAATNEFTADERKRVDEINLKLKNRAKGDEEETLKANGITTGHAAWFAEVKEYTFLGKTIVAHRLLGERLARAEAELSGETPPAGGWFTSAHSLRKVGESLHSFGMAIDIDGGKNPYLLNPDAPNAKYVEATGTSRAISDVINRAVLLVEAKAPAEADLQSRPKTTDKDARALESFDKLQMASDALKRYMELDKTENRASLDTLITALVGKDTRTADKWMATIKADRATLSAEARGKSWNAPQAGFLHLDRRLVKALTSSTGGGLTWLGDDTIGSGRDIMHFDMRGPGPIRKIVKSVEGRTVGLGSG